MRLTTALLSASALSLTVGCGAPLQSSNTPFLVSPHSAERNVATRTLGGLVGGTAIPGVPHALGAPQGWPTTNTTAPILFVSDLRNNAVVLYNPNTPNPSPEGSITNGIYSPSGLAVDKSGSLYVSNFGPSKTGSVGIYPRGKNSPSLTITVGLNGPEGIAVDSHGRVFVANTNSPFQIVGYKPGATTPFETISMGVYGQPVGLAVDSHNNIWAALDTHSKVVEIPAGSTTVQDAGLANLSSPAGISIGNNDEIFVTSLGAFPSGQGYVNVYPYGSTNPTYTITKGIGLGQNGPTLNGLTHRDWLFQSNQFGVVSGYKKGAKTPFSTISGLGDPLGIASSPEVVK